MQLRPEDLQAASTQTIPGLDFYLAIKSRFAKIVEGLGITPRTFVFPEDFDAWRKVAEAESDTIWISKPSNGARGEGIYLITDISVVEPKPNIILQEYIANPHLLDGYKYTLRVYVAVTSLDPLQAWVFPDGLTKLATQPFTADRNSLDNLFIHLTNPGVLRHDTSAELREQRTTHLDYRQRLKHDGHDDDQLFAGINTLVTKSLLAVREPVLQLQQRNAHITFDEQCMLLGYDILVDANMRPWIIEVNAGPSLQPEPGASEREQAIKERVAIDMLRLSGKLPMEDIEFKSLF